MGPGVDRVVDSATGPVATVVSSPYLTREYAELIGTWMAVSI
jgi:hypothetical protein